MSSILLWNFFLFLITFLPTFFTFSYRFSHLFTAVFSNFHKLSQWKRSFSFYRPVALPIAILSKHMPSVGQDVPTRAQSPPYMKYKPRYERFCKWKFADKLKNWNCWKQSQIVIFTFGLLLSFSKYLPWIAIHCSSLSTHFSSIVLWNSASEIFLDFVNDLLITFEELTSQVTLHGWKQQEIAPEGGGGKPRSHSRMKSCECALIANVNGYSSICIVIRH